MSKKQNSRLMENADEMTKGLHRTNVIDETTMCEFNDLCSNSNIFSQENIEGLLYTDVRNNHKLKENQHKKQYIQKLFDRHQKSLDLDFAKKFPEDFLGRAWELTVVDYLYSLNAHGGRLIDITNLSNVNNKQIAKPDFCFEVDGMKIYIEAVCPDTGSREDYPELNQELSEIHGKGRRGGKAGQECRERLTSAFKEKAENRYIGIDGNGYNKYIKNDGFLVAISMAKIPPHNNNMQLFPLSYLSCFFPVAPEIIFPVSLNHDGISQLSGPHFKYRMCFKKAKNSSKIYTDYFGNEKYSYISGAILSCSYIKGVVSTTPTPKFVSFFEMDEFWRTVKNDFILIHNPSAKVKLPINFFPVAQEIIAEVKNEEIIIQWNA
ncbi:MAG: hypothetical protein K0S63_233 [Gammaproteobacteria bacterium]|jgi:hypothetical protein|nr:hypothetical protein [Gammaproteobacteria bacterium]